MNSNQIYINLSDRVLSKLIDYLHIYYSYILQLAVLIETVIWIILLIKMQESVPSQQEDNNLIINTNVNN